MRIITNEGLIRRNKRIGQIATFGSLAILAIGLFISFSYPSQIILAYVALILGFLVSQVGIFFGNRYGRSPRPDELLTQGLKGLDDRYTLYHYTTPATHLLVGPTGLWVLMPFHQKGSFTYEKGHYRQKGGNWYLKIFGQEGLGRPEMEASTQVQDIQKALQKEMPEGNLPPVSALMVFTNDKADVKIEDAPFAGVPLKKMKEAIRRKGKEAQLSVDQVKSLGAIFGDEN